MTENYDNLVYNLSKDIELTTPDEQPTKAQMLSKIDYNINVLKDFKEKLSTVFRYDFEKFSVLQKKLEAAKFENSKLFFKKKIDKVKPSIIQSLLKMNDVDQSIANLQKNKEKVVEDGQTVVDETPSV